MLIAFFNGILCKQFKCKSLIGVFKLHVLTNINAIKHVFDTKYILGLFLTQDFTSVSIK